MINVKVKFLVKVLDRGKSAMGFKGHIQLDHYLRHDGQWMRGKYYYYMHPA
jgi:hypothetical protein